MVLLSLAHDRGARKTARSDSGSRLWMRQESLSSWGSAILLMKAEQGLKAGVIENSFNESVLMSP